MKPTICDKLLFRLIVYLEVDFAGFFLPSRKDIPDMFLHKH